MEANNLCRYLDWDSEFFQYRIAQLTVHHINRENMERIMRWGNAQSIDCLYFCAESNDIDTVKLAEKNGFHLVDVRMTYAKRLESSLLVDNHYADSDIRFSVPEDIPLLKSIARISYHDSRFYYDSNFSDARCDAFYELWIEKSCQGYADVVIVAEDQGQAVGYISCHSVDQTTGKIGLVGVKTDARGKGLGKRLINASLQWFVSHGFTQVIVVTQGRNIAAQRLYQKCGFLTQAVQLFYHRWFTA